MKLTSSNTAAVPVILEFLCVRTSVESASEALLWPIEHLKMMQLEFCTCMPQYKSVFSVSILQLAEMILHTSLGRMLDIES